MIGLSRTERSFDLVMVQKFTASIARSIMDVFSRRVNVRFFVFLNCNAFLRLSTVATFVHIGTMLMRKYFNLNVRSEK